MDEDAYGKILKMDMNTSGESSIMNRMESHALGNMIKNVLPRVFTAESNIAEISEDVPLSIKKER